LKYKPNTKLTNFQSFGIPVISVSYESFVEFGFSSWNVVTTYEELEDKISCFIHDDKYIKRIAKESYEGSVNVFDIFAISKLYQEIKLY
jgi:hypothetical protein